MKTTALILILFLTGLDLMAQTNLTPRVRQLPQRFRNTNAVPAFPAMPAPPAFSPPAAVPPVTSAPATADENSSAQDEMPIYEFNFQGVDVSQVLDIYAGLVGRTILRAGLPSAQIILKTQTKLTKSEAVEALQAVLALNGISVVNVGDKFMKVLQSGDASSAGAEFNTEDASQLPDLGSYVTHIVQLKYVKPSDMVQVLTPFAKLPNAIVALDNNGILIIRDYAENVKRMLEMIDRVDIEGSLSEIVSEVIPIKYAMAEDIANALNSLGGGSTTSIGGSSTAPTINGVSTPRNGTSTQNNTGNGFQSSTGTGRNYGGTSGSFGAGSTANGTPTGGTTFQQRLQSIINRAAGSGQQGEIQIFGQTKIIADERSNSLLVFASRQDMAMIENIVSKLDVLLSQVLIESVIMDVSLDKGLNYGVSVSQNPTANNSSVTTAGGLNNGQPFVNFMKQFTTNGILTGISTLASSNNWPGNFTSTLPGNSFSYFANIGPSWDVAVQAAEADSTINIIQRPRVQTSQAKPAQFFVGSTVPYVTGVSFDSGFSGGNTASYSQLSVGVELDVTPFINPDGLVVMDINQEIDDISGSVPIEGVGNVPTTDKRTLSSEVAVKDRDTIILGGFVRTEKDNNRNGIPLLQDIPWLGALFSSHSVTKNREELIVLMRPTVLKTPEFAAAQAVTEERRLPGISAAAAQNAIDERRQVEAERKAEQAERAAEQQAKMKSGNDGFFTPPPDESADTNNIPEGIQ